MLNKSTNIELIVYTIKDNSTFLLSKSEEILRFPSIDLDLVDPVKFMDRGKEFFLEELFVDNIGIDYRWANPKLLDCEIQMNISSIVTRIFYSCFIPSNTLIKDCYWIKADNMITSSEILKRMLYND